MADSVVSQEEDHDATHRPEWASFVSCLSNEPFYWETPRSNRCQLAPFLHRLGSSNWAPLELYYVKRKKKTGYENCVCPPNSHDAGAGYNEGGPTGGFIWLCWRCWFFLGLIALGSRDDV